MSTDSSDSNKRAANTGTSLVDEARKLTTNGFAIIPLNNRIPIIAW